MLKTEINDLTVNYHDDYINFNSFWKLNSLKKLSLSFLGTPIDNNFALKVHASFPQLTTLCLKACNITHDPFSILIEKYGGQLISLDISYTPLINTSLRLVNQCKFLQELNIEHTDVHHNLVTELCNNLEDLRILNISCNCKLKKINITSQSLQELSIGSCEIKTEDITLNCPENMVINATHEQNLVLPFTRRNSPINRLSLTIVNDNEPWMRIDIKTLTGKTLSLLTQSHFLIDDIKKLIRQQTNLPEEDQRLIFAGKRLEDGRMARDYNMYNGCTLHLVLRLR